MNAVGRVLISAVLVAGVSFGSYEISPAVRTVRLLKNGEYDRAVALSKQQVKNHAVQEVLASGQLQSELNSLVSNARSEQAGDSKVTEELSAIAKLGAGSTSKQAKSYNDQIENYQLGSQSYNDKDYANAVSYLEKVPSGSIVENQADDLKTKALSELEKQVKAEVGNETSNEEYESSIKKLNAALKAAPDDKVISDLLASTKRNYSAFREQNLQSDVDSLVSKKKYSEAISEINEAIDDDSSDETYTDLLNSTEKAYYDQTENNVKKALKDYDYDTASSAVSEAKKVLSDQYQDKLSVLEEEVSNNKPVTLIDLLNKGLVNGVKLADYNSSCTSVGSEESQDFWGNVYKTGTYVADEGSTPIVIHNLGSHTHIRGKIALRDDSYEDSSVNVIFANDDGKERYWESGAMSISTKPVDVDIDLSGKDSVTIEGTDGGFGMNLILSGLAFYTDDKQ